MKKEYLILIFLAGVFLMSTFASAGIWYPTHSPSGANVMLSIDLVQKNPADWSVVANGAEAKVSGIKKLEWKEVEGRYGWQPYYVMSVGSGYHLQPKTSYTLVYYGNTVVNSQYPFVTCIASGKTDTKGRLGGTSWARFDWKSMENDGIDQKFWLVTTSDVDCIAGKLIAWNPANYLFEAETI